MGMTCMSGINIFYKFKHTTSYTVDIS